MQSTPITSAGVSQPRPLGSADADPRAPRPAGRPRRPDRLLEEDAAHALATGWFREAGLETEVDAAGNLIGRIPGRRARGLDGLAPRHRSRRGPFRRDARRRRGAGGGRAPRDAGARRRRLPRRGARLCRQPWLPAPRCLRRAAHRAGADAAASRRAARRRHRDRRLRPRPAHVRRHAGARGHDPMDVRDDALVAAAEYVLHARDAARGIDGAVATIGQVTVEPGGTNVIPGRVVVSVDARAPDAERPRPARGRARDRGARAHRAVADVGGDPCGSAGRGGGRGRAGARAALRRRPRRRHPRERRRPGRDAVRPLLNGGVSHNPAELSSPEDIALATDALTGALRRLVG